MGAEWEEPIRGNWSYVEVGSKTDLPV